VMRTFPPVLLLLVLSACSARPGGPYGTSWDGRRGYDGSGDYGYDLSTSRAAAASYRIHASRSYPMPGPSDDPWGPHIREAAVRHVVPERWIREVMRQESGGRLHAADGSLVTSRAGAMGLMQVMPRTYEMLRRSHGLGDDPYEPRDNILAGAAYIREMYDRFGAPHFLAAYNAGPDRVEAYLAGATVLPDETMNYLARVAPRLGTEVAVARPGKSYVARGTATESHGSHRNAAYQGQHDGMAALDAEDRAFDGGGLVTPLAPTGDRSGLGMAGGAYSVIGAAYAASTYTSPHPGSTEEAAATARTGSERWSERPGGASRTASSTSSGYRAATALVSPAPVLLPVTAPAARRGTWGIQVGAFPDPAASHAAVATARSRAPGLLAGAQPTITPVSRNGVLYRARLIGLSSDVASAACAALSRGGMPCFPVSPGS
jgi:D-alanyl-D-alanine carboxypeptidase